jgi:SNF2 family DNA or RNA helicase
VLDESHRIKAPGGQASRYLARLAVKQQHARRLCLTGTPMPHSPLDLYGQFRFLDPQVFGTSYTRMRARYAECDVRFPSKVKFWKNQDELASKLDAHSWRVTADEVLDLPEAIHETIPVELSPKVMRFYRTDLDDVAAVARELGREYAEVSGERKDLGRWQDGDAAILGVQMQSGGVGIDCSRAAYAFYYSLGFSLGDYEQSLARLRRPGQTRCVRYYHLVCEGTVDAQVYAALRERRNVIEAVLRQLTPRGEAVA